MSMPLLYNIDKFNKTVTIQCSVSMYIEEFTQYTFIQDNQVCDKACATWSTTHSVRPLSPRGVFQGLSARVHDSLAPRSVVALCMSTPTEYGKWARHLLHLVTFKNTCNENTRSKLHVIIHGYIVTVLDVNTYIYVYMINID